MQANVTAPLHRTLVASAAATLFSAALPVSITLIASHVLGGDELGRVGLALWFVSLGALLGASWGTWLVPQVARRPSPASADGVREGIALSTFGGAGVGAIAAAAGLRADLTLACAVGATALGAARVLAAVLQARGAYVRLALAYATGFAVALGALAMALAASATSSTLFASYVVGLVVAVGLAYLMSDATHARALPAATLHEAAKSWSLILVLALIDAILWQRSELFFLHLFRSEREVGQYAAAYAVVATVWLAAAATAGVLLPTLARAMHDRESARVIYGRMWIAASLAFPTLLWVAAGAASVLVGRGGSELHPAPAALAAVLAIGAGPAASGVVASSAFYAAGLVRPMVLVGGVGAAANITLDVALIPAYGMLGAAVATTTVQLCVAGVAFAIASRVLGVRRDQAAAAGIALGAGIIGDVALVLMFDGQAQAGLAVGLLAALVMAGIGTRFAREVRSRTP